jgi:hypothetical protein
MKELDEVLDGLERMINQRNHNLSENQMLDSVQFWIDELRAQADYLEEVVPCQR